MSSQISGGPFSKIVSRLTLIAAIFFCVSLSLAHAQSAGTASIQGTVADPTGAAIASAKVVLTNTETGTSRSTVTDGAGLYSLPNVPVGPYTFDVSVSGFEGFTQKGVLEVGNNVQINAALKVGSSSDHVEVQASGVALETETSSFKQVIDQARITELPLNGRQATQLILISGGAVNAPSNDLIGSKNYFSSIAIAVAGSQGNYNNYVLDGGTNVDTFTNTNLPYPFPDALHEFSVESSSLPARNGVHPGSLVNVVTNSGTNQWHGTAFDFIRNNVVNATNFFSTAKDTVKRNQFGGTLGGKIITDKLFFFGGFQGTRNRQVGNATSYCLPTPAEIAGDFSQEGGLCPASKIGTTAGNPNPLVNPSNGALINTDPTKPNYRKVDPTTYAAPSLALLKYLPYNLADAFGHVNVALPANYTEDQYVGRIDFTLSQKQNLFARFFLANYNQPAYYSPTNILLTTTAGNDERVMNFTLGDTFILNAKTVNTFHGTYARRRDNRGPTAGGINAQTIGVNLFTYVPVDLRLAISGGGFSVGCGTCSPGHFNTQTEDFSDDIDYVRGKHQLAFGVEVIRTGDNTNAGYLQNGNFAFNGSLSGARNGNVGEPLIDYLTGQQNAFSQSRAQLTNYRETIFSAYVQDTFHITQNLTISAGVRWEPLFFPTDQQGRGSTFDQAAFNANQHSTKYPNAPAGSFFYGDAGVPKSFTNNRLGNVSPRLGITLDPFGNGKTVFRAGGAIMYDTPSLFAVQRNTSNPPYVNEIDLTGQIGFANPWNSNSPFPGVFPPGPTSPFIANSLYVVIPREIHSPVVNQWTASVQQDLGSGWNFSLNYLGNKNTHLWLGTGILNHGVYIPGNAISSTPGPNNCGGITTGLPAVGKPCSNTGNTNSRTVLTLKNPSQGISYSPTMTLVDDGANSSYQGVIAAIQHRMAHNFSFLANYTWSHCISVGDAPGDVAAPSYEDPTNRQLDRSNCGFDVRHIFNTTLVASTHFNSLPRFAGAIVNNWEVAPLVRILSGTPLNVTSGIDNSLTGQGLDRPNLVSPTAVYTHKKITQNASGNRFYITSAAFAQNPAGTFGNLGRNAFRQPNYYDLDASITRTFPIYERLALNIRLEAFNVLNHPNFNAFTTALNSSTFGQATGAQDPRIFQLAGKFTF